MLMWFLKRVEAEQEVAEGSAGWGGRESHGGQSGCCHMVHVFRLSKGEGGVSELV